MGKIQLTKVRKSFGEVDVIPGHVRQLRRPARRLTERPHRCSSRPRKRPLRHRPAERDLVIRERPGTKRRARRKAEIESRITIDQAMTTGSPEEKAQGGSAPVHRRGAR